MFKPIWRDSSLPAIGLGMGHFPDWSLVTCFRCTRAATPWLLIYINLGDVIALKSTCCFWFTLGDPFSADPLFSLDVLHAALCRWWPCCTFIQMTSLHYLSSFSLPYLISLVSVGVLNAAQFHLCNSRSSHFLLSKFPHSSSWVFPSSINTRLSVGLLSASAQMNCVNSGSCLLYQHSYL